jgi:hypothetical protein
MAGDRLGILRAHGALVIADTILFSITDTSFLTIAKCAILAQATVLFAIPQHSQINFKIGSMSGANSWNIKGAFFSHFFSFWLCVVF